MSIREVANAPVDYLGMCWDQEGAVVIAEMLVACGKRVEFVKHRDTYYVIKCSI